LTQDVWDNVRTGLNHFQGQRQPAPRHPVRQFFHGLSLPFHLGRALWANPAARRRYLKVGVVQSAVILGLALYFGDSAGDAVDSARGQDTQAERLEERARTKQKVKHTVERFTQAFAPDKASKRRFTIRFGDDTDEDTAGDSDGDTAPQVKRPAKAELTPAAPQGFLAREFAYWAALFATMQLAQWVVIALSRDFHDSVSRDASLLTGLDPEDGPKPPRLRLDTKWLRNKFVRRFRAFKVFALGLPLIYGVSYFLPFRNTVASVLLSLWGAYWLVVFTASKSAHAWKNTQAPAPWFLRGWSWLTQNMPGFRWGLPRAYGRIWAQQTQTVFSPATEMEQQPWAFAGLAVARTLSMVPLVKCFLRPLIPVAAAHLLVSGLHRAVLPSGDGAGSHLDPLPALPAGGQVNEGAQLLAHRTEEPGQ
jgi:hypothetical protein